MRGVDADAAQARIAANTLALMIAAGYEYQRDLAARCGFDTARLSRLLNHGRSHGADAPRRQTWTVPDLVAVADALGLGNRYDLLSRPLTEIHAYLAERG